MNRSWQVIAADAGRDMEVTATPPSPVHSGWRQTRLQQAQKETGLGKRSTSTAQRPDGPGHRKHGCNT